MHLPFAGHSFELARILYSSLYGLMLVLLWNCRTQKSKKNHEARIYGILKNTYDFGIVNDLVKEKLNTWESSKSPHSHLSHSKDLRNAVFICVELQISVFQLQAVLRLHSSLTTRFSK